MCLEKRMEKKTIKIDMTKGVDAAGARLAGQILSSGGLVAFPTETVYGLGANALDAGAARKIYQAKGRPSDNPLIVHIARWEDLLQIASGVTERARLLAEAFWPGPLTMVFQKRALVPPETTGGLGTVAVRMPDHPAALAILREAGGFVAAPSANRSGRPSPTTAAHVAQDLDGVIDCIVDGGEVGIGIESTILDLTQEVPEILRPGFVSRPMLEAVIGEVQEDAGAADAKRPRAPGMKYRHYAPNAEMVVVQGAQGDVVAYINRQIRACLREGILPGVLAAEETKDRYAGGVVLCVGKRSEGRSVARHLYGALREFDARGVGRIFSESFDASPYGQAIMNRLLKAAGHRVVESCREVVFGQPVGGFR